MPHRPYITEAQSDPKAQLLYLKGLVWAFHATCSSSLDRIYPTVVAISLCSPKLSSEMWRKVV